MPRYEAHLIETRTYWMTVEAPDEEAALSFVEIADLDMFHRSSHPDCDLDDLFEVPNAETVDFVVNVDGRILQDLRKDLS